MEAIAKGVVDKIADAQVEHMKRVIRVLRNGYGIAEQESYERTNQLGQAWSDNLSNRPHMTGDGLVLEITNDAANIPQVGLTARLNNPQTGVPIGKPYAIYVHGDLEGVGQAFMHVGKWVPLAEAIDREAYNRKIRAAVRAAIDEAS